MPRLTKNGPYSTRSRRTVVTHSLAPIISRAGHSRVSSVLSDSVISTHIMGNDRFLAMTYSDVFQA